VHDVDLVRVRLRTDLEKELRLPPLDKASVFFFLFGFFGFFALFALCSLLPMQNLLL
jgi:hypothetical protein